MRPLPLRSHRGQDREHHPDHTEVIGLELRTSLFERDLLDGAVLEVPGVVHQDVNPALPFQELLDAGPDGVLGGDVQSEHFRSVRVFEMSLPAGPDHAVAVPGEPREGGRANP